MSVAKIPALQNLPAGKREVLKQLTRAFNLDWSVAEVRVGEEARAVFEADKRRRRFFDTWNLKIAAQLKMGDRCLKLAECPFKRDDRIYYLYPDKRYYPYRGAYLVCAVRYEGTHTNGWLGRIKKEGAEMEEPCLVDLGLYGAEPPGDW